MYRRLHLLVPFAIASLLLAACSQTGDPALPKTTSNALDTASLKRVTQKDVPALSTQAAGNALVYIDYLLGANYVTPALTALGYDITVASNATDFDTKLAADSYELAVTSSQNNGYQGNPTLLDTYISQGGRVVAVDYGKTAGLATVLDAGFTNTSNQTSADFAMPISQDITDPMTLTSRGWGTYSTGLVAAAGGTSYCQFANATSCLVVGNEGRTALLGFLSDTPPAGDGQQLFENIFKLVASEPTPEPDTYTVDFQTAPLNKVLHNVKVGSGVVYSGTGMANTDPIRVDGYQHRQGKRFGSNQAKVLRIAGDKVLAVVKAGTDTPNPSGGELDVKPTESFGGPTPGKNGRVTLTSVTVNGVSTNGARLILYGDSKVIQAIVLRKTPTQTLTLSVSGVAVIHVRANDSFTVDDVVFEVPSTR